MSAQSKLTQVEPPGLSSQQRVTVATQVEPRILTPYRTRDEYFGELLETSFAGDERLLTPRYVTKTGVAIDPDGYVIYPIYPISLDLKEGILGLPLRPLSLEAALACYQQLEETLRNTVLGGPLSNWFKFLHGEVKPHELPEPYQLKVGYGTRTVRRDDGKEGQISWKITGNGPPTPPLEIRGCTMVLQDVLVQIEYVGEDPEATIQYQSPIIPFPLDPEKLSSVITRFNDIISRFCEALYLLYLRTVKIFGYNQGGSPSWEINVNPRKLARWLEQIRGTNMHVSTLREIAGMRPLNLYFTRVVTVGGNRCESTPELTKAVISTLERRSQLGAGRVAEAVLNYLKSLGLESQLLRAIVGTWPLTLIHAFRADYSNIYTPKLAQATTQ